MSNDFSVNRAVVAIREGWLVVATAIIASIGVASVYLHTAQYKYVASYQVTPAQSSAMDSIGSKFGGLAAVAGLSLPSSPSESNFQLYIKSLHSREVAAELARDESLIRKIFDSEWAPSTGRWHAPSDRLAFIKRPIKAVLGVPTYPWQRPDAARVQEFLQKSIKVDQSPKEPVVVISFAHSDPVFAGRVLTELDRRADSILRRRALLRSTEYIRHLTAKLATVSVAELRVAIAEALSEQEKVRMTASSTLPFAAEIFSKPSVSPRPMIPDPRLVIVAAFFIGAFGGIVIILVRNGRRRASLDGPAA